VDLVFYAQQLLGPQLELLREQIDSDRPPTRLEVVEVAAAVHDAIQSVDELLLPPVLKLEVGPLTDPEPGAVSEPEEKKSLALLMFPGILMMSLLFVAQGTSPDLWSERRLGTLRRAASAPGGLSTFLLGKLLSTAGLMAAIALLGVCSMCVFFELDPLQGLLGVLWVTATAAGFALLMQYLQVLSGSERGGGLITMLVLFPLLMLGGSFFPFEAMPDGLAAIGRRTPNGMALVEFARVLDGEVVAASLLRTATAFLLASLLLFGLLARRVRTRFAPGAGA
jgi:ABC-type multidrug transport system permease subunit